MYQHRQRGRIADFFVSGQVGGDTGEEFGFFRMEDSTFIDTDKDRGTVGHANGEREESGHGGDENDENGCSSGDVQPVPIKIEITTGPNVESPTDQVAQQRTNALQREELPIGEDFPPYDESDHSTAMESEESNPIDVLTPLPTGFRSYSSISIDVGEAESKQEPLQSLFSNRRPPQSSTSIPLYGQGLSSSLRSLNSSFSIHEADQTIPVPAPATPAPTHTTDTNSFAGSSSVRRRREAFAHRARRSTSRIRRSITQSQHFLRAQTMVQKFPTCWFPPPPPQPISNSFDEGSSSVSLYQSIRSWRRRFFLLLAEPGSARGSALLFSILICAILLSNLLMILQTMKFMQYTPTDCSFCGGDKTYLFEDSKNTFDQLDKSGIMANVEDANVDDDEMMAMIECVCPPAPRPILEVLLNYLLYYLTAEWCLRIISFVPKTPRPTLLGRLYQFFRYVTTISNLIDALGIFPYYLESLPNSFVSLRLVRIFRIFQLVRLGQYNAMFLTLSNVLKRSMQYLRLLVLILFFGAGFFGSMLYWLERGTWKYYQPTGDFQFVRISVDGVTEEITPFNSIPSAFWWFMVTATTVGYGDYYPTSTAGKFCATLAMLMGVLTVAFPVSVFSDLWSAELQRVKGFNAHTTGISSTAIGGGRSTTSLLRREASRRQFLRTSSGGSSVDSDDDDTIFNDENGGGGGGDHRNNYMNNRSYNDNNGGGGGGGGGSFRNNTNNKSGTDNFRSFPPEAAISQRNVLQQRNNYSTMDMTSSSNHPLNNSNNTASTSSSTSSTIPMSSSRMNNNNNINMYMDKHNNDDDDDDTIVMSKKDLQSLLAHLDTMHRTDEKIRLLLGKYQ